MLSLLADLAVLQIFKCVFCATAVVPGKSHKLVQNIGTFMSYWPVQVRT